jgi:hypothetical protein
MEVTTGWDFYNDALARKVTIFLVIFQVSALFVGLILTVVRHAPIALFLAFISLILLLGALWWFYIRYQSYPIVHEKRKLKELAEYLPPQILAHTTNLQLTHQNREKLEYAEESEILAALLALQRKHIESRMSGARIEDADIPGVGPEQIKRLSAHGISTAADINPFGIRVEGVDDASTQAILEWRKRVFSHFDATRPASLPPERHAEIRKKYEIQQANNDTEQQKSQEKKKELENTWRVVQPRIDQLLPITFFSFLRHGLASRGIVAGVLGFGILSSHLLLGTIAISGAIIGVVPKVKENPEIIFTPTATFTETMPLLVPFTETPTITDTPTFTATPTMSPTQSPTQTLTKSPTWTPLPGVNTVVPIPLINCDPSYPTVCIPPPPPDLDCRDIPYRLFQVLPPDPHLFDSNGDGIGCSIN